MQTFDEIDQIQKNNKVDFKYGGIRIVVTSRAEGTESWNSDTKHFVDILWNDTLLTSSNESISKSIADTFSAVRVCRPGIFELVGSDRSQILIVLSALAELHGVGGSPFYDTPEIETRLHPDSERIRKAFKHWDDRPQVLVYASMSSIDRRNFDNESVKYRIVMSTYATTFTHSVNGPAWELPDIYTLVEDLVVKHFGQ